MFNNLKELKFNLGELTDLKESAQDDKESMPSLMKYG